MPQISIFLGIIIKMYYRDHNPPHFHAVYGEYEGLVDINNLELLSGHLPPRVLGLVIEWAAIHQSELLHNWDKAMKQETLLPIQPLV
ncbi:DUF4160 domain-containing protein [Nemorincola caseinilytica]|uniref:DUF4160 domain-containing protein n=1 Tax=Nemorincola caseinilytica TaxID=2054315 RepID=UPI003CD079CE